MLTLAVQFVLGLLYANAGEWLMHKYILHAPIFLIFPLFTSAVYASLALYYYKHRKAHLDPVWARRHLRWHYEHHLGGNICANWCVTWPWFDYLMGTGFTSKTLD